MGTVAVNGVVAPPLDTHQRQASSADVPEEAAVDSDEYAELRQIAQLQREDEELRPLVEYLSNQVLPRDPFKASMVYREASSYTLGDHGQLQRVQPVDSRQSGREVLTQLVVPRSMRHELLECFHNDPLSGGHLGITATYWRMHQRYYWPGMSVAVRQWCKACQACARQKTPRRTLPYPTLSMPIASAPFEFVGVDVLGPFPRSTAGNRYVVVFSDYCTRWPEAFAIRNQKATTIADCLLELVTRYGVPKTLLSDQGANFLSELSQAIYRLLNIDKRRTTAYHPQTNGLTERFNHTLSTMLAVYVDKNQKDWDVRLNMVLFAYRTTVQQSIGHSPFRMLFGHEARMPLDAMLIDDEEQYSSPFVYVRDLIQRLQDVRAIAHANLTEIAQKRAAAAEQLAQRRQFKAGDRVYVWSPPAYQPEIELARKLQPTWHGPYTVIEQLSPVTYRVRRDNSDDGRGGRRQEVIHVSHMKACNDDKQLHASVPPAQDSDSELDADDAVQLEDSHNDEQQQQPAASDAADGAAAAEEDSFRFAPFAGTDDELVSFDPDDHVWLYTYARKWHGPYVVLERRTPVTWLVESMVNERRQQLLVHTLQMQPYTKATEPPDITPDMQRVTAELRDAERVAVARRA